MQDTVWPCTVLYELEWLCFIIRGMLYIAKLRGTCLCLRVAPTRENINIKLYNGDCFRPERRKAQMKEQKTRKYYTPTNKHVIWQTIIIFTRYSTAPFVGGFFIPRGNKTLISAVEVVIAGCATSHYALNALEFIQTYAYLTQNTQSYISKSTLRSSRVPQRELRRTCYTGNRDMTHSLTQECYTRI
jgi:hypothetical protein